MEEKPKFRLSDDGELEPYEEYHPRKSKRHEYGGGTKRNPALIALILFQAACVGGMCLLLGMILTGIVTVDELKCRLLASCDDRPTPFVRTNTFPTGARFFPTLTPPATPAFKLSEAQPCTSSFLSRPESQVSFISDAKYPFGAAYLLNIRGLNSCLLLTNTEGVYSLAWSSDGNRIAFTSSRGLWLANELGQEQHFIYADVWTNDAADWSPDNTRIAFTSKAERLTIFDLKSNETTVVTESSFNAHSPRWSPDGQQLLFSAGRDADSELYIIDATGDNIRRLTENNVYDGSPVWMQAGEYIVYVSEQDGNPEIYSLELKTGIVSRLRTNETRDILPDVSLQSGRIVYVSYVIGNNEILIMSADGQERGQLTFSASNDTMPVWRR